MDLSVDFREVSMIQRIKIMKKGRYTGRYHHCLSVYITDLILFLCLVARLVWSEPQLRVEVEYTWFMGYHQVTVMMMTTLGMIFPAVMFPVLQVRWEQNHISSVIIIIHSGSLSRAIHLAAQSALLSMQAESLLVDATAASLIRVSMNEDTRWPRCKSLYSVNQICFFLAAWVKMYGANCIMINEDDNNNDNISDSQFCHWKNWGGASYNSPLILFFK